MDFDDVLSQVLELLQRDQRVSYRALKRRFGLDDDYLEDVKDELIYAKKLAADEDSRVLVWIGDIDVVEPTTHSTPEPERAPSSYTPMYLAEKILTGKTSLEGERKQVTVLFGRRPIHAMLKNLSLHTSQRRHAHGTTDMGRLSHRTGQASL